MSKTPYGKQPSFSRLDPKYFYPQNFPSVVVGHVLDPESADHILDMCAAPGIYFFSLMKARTRHVRSLQKLVQKIREMLQKMSKRE